MANAEAELLRLAQTLPPIDQLVQMELDAAQEPARSYAWTYGSLHVPDLVQTPEYARAIMSKYAAETEAAPKEKTDVVERGLAVRLGRQELMSEVNQEFFIADAALRGIVWGENPGADIRGLQVQQLKHLLGVQATRRNVTIRVVPPPAEAELTALFRAPLPEFALLLGASGKMHVFSDGPPGRQHNTIGSTGELQGVVRINHIALYTTMNAKALLPDSSTAYVQSVVQEQEIR